MLKKDLPWRKGLQADMCQHLLVENMPKTSDSKDYNSRGS